MFLSQNVINTLEQFCMGFFTPFCLLFGALYLIWNKRDNVADFIDRYFNRTQDYGYKGFYVTDGENVFLEIYEVYEQQEDIKKQSVCKLENV